ncbi:DUF2330 domain-containing protein [bacterium]|nr:DUF2330 domain-containing protein [bacterium]
MKRLIPYLILLATVTVTPLAAKAFCGFYVAKADTKLFNKASKVVMVRDGNRTVLTMANDYQGEPKEFAIVVPVPTMLEKDQIHVANPALIDHLDSYTAPRLVEYFDENPCNRRVYKAMSAMSMDAAAPAGAARNEAAKKLGVTIEAEYTVGEYDILILSAKESSGLETWLTDNGYKIPSGASEVLGSYIRQNVKFFVAKVNLEEQSKLGFNFLRPLQIAFESPKFMLPIRLGTVNANGTQDLFVFALTKTGRVESTNYRTVKLPEGMDLPAYVKDDFANFYRDMFSTQVKKEDMQAVFLEYAWDMSWCDPCAADPLSNSELKELGVFWVEDPTPMPVYRKPQSGQPGQVGNAWGGSAIAPVPAAANVYVTRLHVRYDAEHFPEDLMFQETGNRENFQARYVLRHPWQGSDQCPEANSYREELKRRQTKEVETLSTLTGWEVDSIERKMGLHPGTSGAQSNSGSNGSSGDKWWKDLWR